MAERKKKVLLTANLKIALIKCGQELKNAYLDLTSTVYAWHGYFISPYWRHTQLKYYWSKYHTAKKLNNLTLTRKIQREWTLFAF
jgi:hypothetical protein